MTISVLAAGSATAVNPIPPNDPLIEYRRLFFADVQPTIAYLNRFTQELLSDPNRNFNNQYAETQPGVAVRFCTTSNSVTARFQYVPGYHNIDIFSIYQDGIRTEVISGLTLNVTSNNPGQSVTYEIVCPSYSNVAFIGLDLDDGVSLSACSPINKPRYVAFGDSITHSAGQDGTSDTSYDWVLARDKGWELFNLAVGGAKVGPPIGSMLDNESFDLATVLWGFNDWNSENNLPLYQSRYNQFLDNLRAVHTQPVYCFTPIHTTKLTPNKNNGYTMDQYRDTVRQIVATRRAAGDNNLFVINGEDLTTADDLYDGIHLTHEGAASFADLLMDFVMLPPPTSLPNAPDNLNATTVDAREIHLSWTDNADNENYFKIERSQNDTSNWTQIDTVRANVTSYIDADLPLFTTFYYRVRAYNYLGDSPYSNEANTSTWAHGDFDGDNDVDQEDFGHLQQCMTGSGNQQNDPDCLDTLLDGDQDVDLEDFVIFQACMSGANIPPTPGCAD
ncbi:MAG: fibronectin type III domain-containing protein [Planctomycetota bacterium]|nr:MAG: fibronectin type III domain-containing protein [Planctomycetota bacterium]